MVANVVPTDIRLRRQLPRAWPLFFQSFGRLRPIQRMTIPFVLQGQHLVIMAPTASGKTEAVFAPLVEQWARARWVAPSILYVAPTRALVNDMARRLDVVTTVGMTIGRRTMDHREVQRNRLPDIVLTTPESLDSMLTRFPEVWTRLRAYVLDEVHLIIGEDRGVQLAGLIARLRRIVERTAQRAPVAFVLSATIGSPENVGHRFCGPTFRIVQQPGQRWLQCDGMIAWEGDAQTALEIVQWMRTHGHTKVLVFANTKMQVESLSTHLRMQLPGNAVLTHHGRLPRKTRLEVEHAFRRSALAVCVATTTLELGIDIGDVDGVVLVGAPPSMASFLQRVGRSNRRADVIRLLAFHRDPLEAIFLETFLELAESGWVEPNPLHRSMTAATQQMLSYIMQKRRVGTTPHALRDLVRALDLDLDVSVWIARRENQGWIIRQRGLCYPGPRLFEAFEKGYLHSLIGDIEQPVWQVVDRQGQVVAEIQVDGWIPPGERLSIGGRIYQVLEVRFPRLVVQSVRATDPDARTVFAGAPPVYWTYPIGPFIRQKLFPHIDPTVIPFYVIDDRCVVVHAFGYLHALVWSYAVAEAHGWHVDTVDGLSTSFRMRGGMHPHAWQPDTHTVRSILPAVQPVLERIIAQGPFYRILSEDERRQHLEWRLQWPEFAAFLQQHRWGELDIGS